MPDHPRQEGACSTPARSHQEGTCPTILARRAPGGSALAHPRQEGTSVKLMLDREFIDSLAAVGRAERSKVNIAHRLTHEIHA